MLKHFNFWCQKVLPLVYDDSLSYYELLCKIVKYINELIEQDKIFADDIEELKAEIIELKKRIDDFDETYAKELLEKYIATMIFVEITDDGYIIYYIPETWKDIIFNTTNLDIEVEGVNEYGRLVLSY